MSTGKKLRELRGDKSQELIASEIGVTKSAWSMYERDERTPRDEVKVRIANYFRVSVQKLFFEVQNTYSANLDNATCEELLYGKKGSETE